MSSIYCVWCGDEIGPEHRKDCKSNTLEEDQWPPREQQYCVVCGIIPAPGAECIYYAKDSKLEYCLSANESTPLDRLKSGILCELHQAKVMGWDIDKLIEVIKERIRIHRN